MGQNFIVEFRLANPVCLEESSVFMRAFKVLDPEPIQFRLSFRPSQSIVVRLLKNQNFEAILQFFQYQLLNQSQEILILNRCLSYYQIVIDLMETFS